MKRKRIFGSKDISFVQDFQCVNAKLRTGGVVVGR